MFFRRGPRKSFFQHAQVLVLEFHGSSLRLRLPSAGEEQPTLARGVSKLSHDAAECCRGYLAFLQRFQDGSTGLTQGAVRFCPVMKCLGGCQNYGPFFGSLV